MQGIEFQIVNDSAKASKGLDELSASLNKLKSNLGGAGTSLSNAAAGITSIKNALNKMNTGDFESQLQRISKGLEALNTKTAGLKISSSIGNQLREIGSSLNAMPDTAQSKLNSLAEGLKPLSELGKQQIGPFLTQLKKLPDIINDLQAADIDTFTQQMKDLASAMKPFADEMQKVSNGFSAFPSRIQKLVKSTEQYNGTVKKAATHTNAWGSALKTLSIGAVFRTVSQLLASAIDKSNQYTETLNMFTVSMGEYAQEAYEYAQKVSDVMGIDPSTWMENQGVFNSIITGFGVAGDKAAIMSKNLTQLAYDLSSFYNMDITSAMQKVQSGISGELEPLRRLGYDLSVARLQQEALNLGIEKSVSDMTQAEKAQLRYHAMLTQVTHVQGDMARTLQEPENQLRVLKAQVEKAARAFGNIFIPILNAVLPVAIAVASAVREIVSAIAALFGVQMADSVDFEDTFGSAAGATGDIADNMDSAAGSAEELKRYLAGFDELNVLPDQSSSGGGSSAGGGGSGFDIEPIDYDFLAGAVTQKVDEIKAKLQPFVDWIKDNLEKILTVCGAIGEAILAWKVASELMSAFNMIQSFSTIGTIVIGIALAVTGFSLEASGIESAMSEGLNGLNFTEIVGGGVLGTTGVAALGGALAKWISTAFSGSAVAGAISTAGANLGIGTAAGVGTALSAGAAGIIAGIPAMFVGIYDAIQNGLNWLNGILVPAGATAAGAGIGTIIGALGGPVTAGIGALIGLATGVIVDGLLFLSQDEKIGAGIRETFSKIFEPITPIIEHAGEAIDALWKEHLKPLWDEISKFAASIGSALKDFTIAIGRVWTVSIKPCVDAIISFAAPYIVTAINMVVDVLRIAFSFVSDVFSGVLTILRGLVSFLDGVFIGDWNKIWNDGIVTIFKGACDTILAVLKAVANVAILIVNTLFSTVYAIIASVVNTVSDIATKIGQMFGKDWGFQMSTSVPKSLQISYFATGGFPETGQLFIAREAGAEMVGSIGNRTAVANNDQIVAAVSQGVSNANDDVVTAIYAVAQQIIAEMREQDKTGNQVDVSGTVAQAQRRNARVYGY